MILDAAKVTIGSPVTISYGLTTKGRSLTVVLEPVQQWTQHYKNQ
ncbi:winged helix-turn-helix transcriptional regulator [Paenibacillus sp. IHBB 10380]|nr:winged helix-turn-helix transcriptional regulator [Paenibacillus sp. IHBB 10380]